MFGGIGAVAVGRDTAYFGNIGIGMPGAQVKADRVARLRFAWTDSELVFDLVVGHVVPNGQELQYALRVIHVLRQ